MSRKMIAVEESFAAWRKNPVYEKAYNVLQDEFTRAAAIIEAPPPRGRTGYIEAQRTVGRNSDAIVCPTIAIDCGTGVCGSGAS